MDEIERAMVKQEYCREEFIQSQNNFMTDFEHEYLYDGSMEKFNGHKQTF
jgi:hypothetical protein